jgi:hypothetical protein
MISQQILQETKDNNSALIILFDDYICTREEFIKRVFSAFSLFNKIQKGICFEESTQSIKIDNKYYKCELKITLESYSGFIKHSQNCEGLVILCDKTHLDTERLGEIIQNSKQKPNLGIILFQESRSEVSSSNKYENFVGMAIDNNFEIITDMSNVDEINEDDGIGALNMSLQSSHWANSTLKKEEKNLESECAKVENKKLEYEKLDDEIDFDNFLEKINEMRKMNANENLSDDERRKNAEDAIMMLAKYINIGDEEDLDNESN